MLTRTTTDLRTLYRYGVKTPETRAAWAQYRAQRREEARERRAIWEAQNPGQRYIADVATHGSGCYTNHACDCPTGRVIRKLGRRS